MTTLMPFAPGPSALQRNALSRYLGWKFTLPSAQKTIGTSGFYRPDVLWIDSLFQNYLWDLLEPKNLCIRVADHPEHIARLSTSLRTAFYESLHRASLVVTPNKFIAEYLTRITSSPVSVIPNGVNINHFQKPVPAPVEYADEPRRKLVFVGSLARWIDFRLIQHLAEVSPDWAFYLIGPVQDGVKLARAKNISYLGSKPYADIPAYLQHADIALAPFNVAEFPTLVESVDALKLYEYIAAGTPVIATRWSQSEELAPFVMPAEQSASAFRSLIKEVLRNRGDHIASPEQIAGYNWSSRLAHLPDLIGAHEFN